MQQNMLSNRECPNDDDDDDDDMMMTMMIWCFMSLSTLIESYQDDEGVIMKSSVQ